MELLRDLVALGNGQCGPGRKRVRVGPASVGPDRREKRGQVRRFRNLVMVRRDGGFGRQKHPVGLVVARLRVERRKVEDRRDERDPGEHDAVVLQPLGEHARSRRAVALAGQILRRIPAAVRRDVPTDELRERLAILVDAVKIFAGCMADDPAEARADRIDEHEVARAEQTILVVDDPIRRRTRGSGVRGHHRARPEGAEVNERRRPARAAVVGKRDRAFGFRAEPVGGIRDVEDARRGRVLRVREHDRSGRRRVANFAAADQGRMVGDGGGDARDGNRIVGHRRRRNEE